MNLIRWHSNCLSPTFTHLCVQMHLPHMVQTPEQVFGSSLGSTSFFRTIWRHHHVSNLKYYRPWWVVWPSDRYFTVTVLMTLLMMKCKSLFHSVHVVKLQFNSLLFTCLLYFTCLSLYLFCRYVLNRKSVFNRNCLGSDEIAFVPACSPDLLISPYDFYRYRSPLLFSENVWKFTSKS
jgi:hypothetical protein